MLDDRGTVETRINTCSHCGFLLRGCLEWSKRKRQHTSDSRTERGLKEGRGSGAVWTISHGAVSGRHAVPKVSHPG